MKNFFLSLIIALFTSTLFAADEKVGRFFEDQPDVTDEHQIHFIYLIPSDGEDRELDINGSMENILEKANNVMFEATNVNKDSGGIGKKYRYDYRKNGKLDITFIRTVKNWKDLKNKSVNTQVSHYFQQVSGFNNKKKTYFLWTDVNKGDHGGDNHMLSNGTKLNKNLYTHNIEGCPQLIDSVYLTPTSKNPYDPYKIMCDRDLGKYTHPKLVKLMAKATKKINGIQIELDQRVTGEIGQANLQSLVKNLVFLGTWIK
jgi:hypothetical protein